MPQPRGNMFKEMEQSGDEALAPFDHTHTAGLPALLSLSFPRPHLPDILSLPALLPWVSVAPGSLYH